jgi:hypothetical protein
MPLMVGELGRLHDLEMQASRDRLSAAATTVTSPLRKGRTPPGLDVVTHDEIRHDGIPAECEGVVLREIRLGDRCSGSSRCYSVPNVGGGITAIPLTSALSKSGGQA